MDTVPRIRAANSPQAQLSKVVPFDETCVVWPKYRTAFLIAPYLANKIHPSPKDATGKEALMHSKHVVFHIYPESARGWGAFISPLAQYEHYVVAK